MFPGLLGRQTPDVGGEAQHLIGCDLTANRRRGVQSEAQQERSRQHQTAEGIL